MKLALNTAVALFLVSYHPFVAGQSVTEAMSSDFTLQVPTCNDIARSWIRAAFHDAGTFDLAKNTGGMDGSLQFELDRPENKGLEETVKFYKTMASKHKISMADALAFGGRLAFQACTGQTLSSFQMGRKDATTANERGKLPNPGDAVDATINNFVVRMGFSMMDTVALIGGSHSTAFTHRENSGLTPGRLDSTPDKCDSVYFRELGTPARGGEVRIEADRNMLKNTRMASVISQFANNESSMLQAYSRAYARMLNMGFLPVSNDNDLVTTTTTSTTTTTTTKTSTTTTKTSSTTSSTKTSTTTSSSTSDASTSTSDVSPQPTSIEEGSIFDIGGKGSKKSDGQRAFSSVAGLLPLALLSSLFF